MYKVYKIYLFWFRKFVFTRLRQKSCYTTVNRKMYWILLVPLIGIGQFRTDVAFLAKYCCHPDSQNMPQIIQITLIHTSTDRIKNADTFWPKVLEIVECISYEMESVAIASCVTASAIWKLDLNMNIQKQIYWSLGGSNFRMWIGKFL